MTSAARRTDVLEALRGGRESLDQLIVVLYDELRDIAHRHRAARGDVETLATTALVHEAYLKLVDQQRVQWQNRAQFFAVAARVMRRLLVDHARSRNARKRGAAVTVPLTDVDPEVDPPAPDILALDEALAKLTALDPRQATLVELRFFGGLTVEEAAEVMAIAPITVKRDWAMARTWLYRELGGHAS